MNITALHALEIEFDRFLAIAPVVDGPVPILNSTLLKLIECPYLEARSNVVVSITPFDAPGHCERMAYIPPLLSAVLRHKQADVSTTNLSSLLWGVQKHNMLEIFKKDADCAYDLSIAILRFIGSRTYNKLDILVATVLVDLLNDWLRPDHPWDELPSALVVAKAMFGEAWWHLADRPFFVGGYTASNIVEQERPPFLTGLCPAQDGIPSVPLPELGFAP